MPGKAATRSATFASAGRSGMAAVATPFADTGVATRGRWPSSAIVSPAPANLYQSDGLRLSASVNYVTAHDGFALADLVSYNVKHNEGNGLGNRDGADENFSSNCGVEGRRQMRNFLRDGSHPAREQHCLLPNGAGRRRQHDAHWPIARVPSSP